MMHSYMNTRKTSRYLPYITQIKNENYLFTSTKLQDNKNNHSKE